MQLTYIIPLLLFAVGSLALTNTQVENDDDISQFNCANQIFSEEEVLKFFNAAERELALTQASDKPRMPLLEPYDPNPSSRRRKPVYYSFIAFRLRNTKVPKHVIIDNYADYIGMAWGFKAEHVCLRREVTPQNRDRPWDSKQQAKLWDAYKLRHRNRL
ncbi:BgtE-5965 [Blumeria graminis f. sp. tritici]|uniref:BgtE-5965 n=2 Tax=Blumeria graminis f. sp. tritici TaxID=62690 RepID=A0A9X9MEP5_BLUGR|nr:putative secreted effector protein [Blumeria graminis f. sp. tritici 96224]VDB83836.1 BgtE-5965 [Blumeria graminis f. sp. tritici]